MIQFGLALTRRRGKGKTADGIKKRTTGVNNYKNNAKLLPL